MLPCMFGCPLYIWKPHAFRHPNALLCSNNPPYVPKAPLCICMFWGYLCANGEWGSSLVFGQSPCVWMPSCVSNIPHAIICSSACLYVLGVICMYYEGNIPYVWGWGLRHICQVFGVCQYIHWMSIMLHLVPLL